MEPIKSSELITNADGSVFHLHLHPEDLAEQVILVGDPSRVEMIASYFHKTCPGGVTRPFYNFLPVFSIKYTTTNATGSSVPSPDITRDTACRLSLPELVRITSTS